MRTELAQLADAVPITPHKSTKEIATIYIGNQMFGIAILEIHDILMIGEIFGIPLAQKSIAGSINLRGRIVTVINLRTCLGLANASARKGGRQFCVTVEHGGDIYGFLVDQIGDVIQVSNDMYRPVPPTLNANWRSVSTGVFLVEKHLLLQLDTTLLLDKLLETGRNTLNLDANSFFEDEERRLTTH